MAGVPPVPGYIPLSQMQIPSNATLDEFADFRTCSDTQWWTAFGRCS